MERSLVIVKPDGVQRGLIGSIVARFEAKGFKITGMKMIRITRELAERHYGEHKGKPFYDGLVDYITCGPVVVLAVEGPGAVEIIRRMMGPTNGAEAACGTIRGDYAVSLRYNLVHGSDSLESAKRELELFFTADELLDYDRDILKWSWQC